MHDAVSQRKHEDFDVDPSENVTTAALPGNTSTATGTRPTFRVLGATLLALCRENILDISDSFHFCESVEI